MKKILAIFSAAVLLFTACDKIEPGENGEYTVYAGITATWTEADPIANPVQCALIDKYTGPQCVNCPYADASLNDAQANIGNQMIVIAINPRNGDGAPFSGQPDMSTDDGEKWVAYFCGNSNPNLPMAFINRDSKYEGSGDIATMEPAIAAAVAQTPTAAVEMAAATGADGKVGIDVTVNLLQATSSPLTLTLALTEDSLVYLQAGASNPNYTHNHMLRDVITDVWGIDVELDGNAGVAGKAHFTYALPANVVKENCHIVAILSDKATRHVVNCTECKIDE